MRASGGRCIALAATALLLAGVFFVGVLNASRPGARPEGCPQGCARVGGGAERQLRVLSLNMLHAFPRFENLPGRLDLIAAEIRHQDADIVCLQEVPWTRQLGSGAAYLAARTGLNYLYLRANGNRHLIFFEEGEAILSRYPLREAGSIAVQPRAGFFEHRVVLYAVCATPWGDVRVFVTHLTHGDREINRKQAAWLAAFVERTGTGPAIVAGDFNAREDSPQIQALTRAWIDTYRAAGSGDAGLTCCIDDLRGGPDEPLEARIDYLFLVPWPEQDIIVQEAGQAFGHPYAVPEGWQWASDHIGLVALLALDD